MVSMTGIASTEYQSQHVSFKVWFKMFKSQRNLPDNNFQSKSTSVLVNNKLLYNQSEQQQMKISRNNNKW